MRQNALSELTPFTYLRRQFSCPKSLGVSPGKRLYVGLVLVNNVRLHETPDIRAFPDEA